MAKQDRCVICDYTEQEGSGYAGVSPSRHGAVRRYGDQCYCDTCLDHIIQNYATISGTKEDE